jgi:hypothetical protein
VSVGLGSATLRECNGALPLGDAGHPPQAEVLLTAKQRRTHAPILLACPAVLYAVHCWASRAAIVAFTICDAASRIAQMIPSEAPPAPETL